MKHYLVASLLLSCLGINAQEEVITDTTKLSYKIYFIERPYYRVNYTYQSVAPDGVTPVTLSSALVFPNDVFNHNNSITIGADTYDACGLILNNHFTITKKDDAPTQTDDMQIEGALSVLESSSIIISPDGYGFGVTEDKPQAYLMADATARNNIDAVKAARRILSKMGYSYSELFAQIGYSQGGHSAIATQRYVDTHVKDNEGISGIDYTLCGAGPYDISAMLDTLLLPDARYQYPCAVPLIIEGQIGGAGLGISYSDCFPTPLDTKAIEWLDSKLLSTEAINDSIYATVGGDSRNGVLVSSLLLTDNMQRSNSKMQPFFDAVDYNSLVSGWKPNDHTRFFVYHSAEDEIVPFFNMEHLVNFLQKDCGITEDRFETYESSGSHSSAATMFVITAVAKLKNMTEEYLAGTYEPASITSPRMDAEPLSTVNKGWYNLQGQRLPARPQSAGIYIYNGKKIVISDHHQ